MSFSLPELPYSYDALEPHIDARTMEIHHAKHHAGYVKNLNDALEACPSIRNTGLEDLLRDIRQVPEAQRQIVRNNGGGHANHSLFWSILSPNAPRAPSGELAEGIRQSFGGLEAFQSRFEQAAIQRFGSGWAWLAVSGSGQLEICSTPNQDSPYMLGLTPILGLDVWEHAYYLNYQNRRADYIRAFWSVVDWSAVSSLHSMAVQLAASRHFEAH